MEMRNKSLQFILILFCSHFTNSLHSDSEISLTLDAMEEEWFNILAPSTLRDEDDGGRPVPFKSEMGDLVPPEERSRCRKFVLVMAKRLMRIFNACVRDVKALHPAKGAIDKYFQCIIKCSVHKVHMVSEDYKFSNITFAAFVEQHIPVSYHNLCYRISIKCVAEYSQIIKGDDNDPLCTTYGDMIKCMQNTVADQCKSDTIQM